MRQEYDIELKDFQKDYLAGITEKYDLPDMGKAIRCLIDYAIEMEEQEIEIFKLERCHSCDWSNDYFRWLNPGAREWNQKGMHKSDGKETGSGWPYSGYG